MLAHKAGAEGVFLALFLMHRETTVLMVKTVLLEVLVSKVIQDHRDHLDLQETQDRR